MRAQCLILLALSATAMAQSYGLTKGPVKLQSAEKLTFGPDGILFVGDSLAGSVVALDTGDRTPQPSSPDIAIVGIDQKVAAMLGTTGSQIRFNDTKVNPISKTIYLAVSRGRGPDAIPVLLRIGTGGAISELNLENIPHASVALPGIPDSPKGRPRRTSRVLAITDLHYVDGKLVVAGLSNEDFSSTLRVLPFPFTTADRGTSVEIYHTSHFAYETNSPVRTMISYTQGKERFLLAAYTCTPLVRLRMSDLKSGAKVTGETLAELGRHSSPLDMILYEKDGHQFLLVANTLYGVTKMSLGDMAQYTPVSEYGGDDSQIPMQKVKGLKGVVQLNAYDASRALMLFDVLEGLDLRTVPLP